MFNVTINNNLGGVGGKFYLWKKAEYKEKTINLSHCSINCTLIDVPHACRK